MARDMAIKFNNTFGETFTIPEPDIPKEIENIPGTNGQKMSKSYGNTIPIFDNSNVTKKAVMGIVTDSKGMDEPKEPKGNTIYELYKLFASADETKEMEQNFKKGGMGYGDAKKLLLEKILETFEPFREKRNELEKNPKKVEMILEEGAAKVKEVSHKTMEKVRAATGLKY